MNQSQFNNYWIKRQALRQSAYFSDADNLLKALNKTYAKNYNMLQKELAVIYNKYMETGKGIYRATYVKQLMTDISPRLTKVFLAQNKDMTKLFGKVYENEFYHSVYDLGKAGLQFNFTLLDNKAVRKVLAYPWSGVQFSDRLWENKDKLVYNLKQTLTQGLIQGQDYSRMTQNLANRMDASFAQSATLVKTETAHFMSQATLDGYEEAGIEKYRYLATLDDRTSDECQDLDGKEFPLSEAATGVNYPPMHPNCRSTTVAVIEGRKEGTRRAKEDGEWVDIPESMNYKQWREKVA